MAGQAEYEAVLADLRAKRDELDRTIATLEALAGLSTGPTIAARADSMQDIQTDAFFSMSIPDAVKKYLAIVKKKQNTTDITKALERGGLQHTSKNFYTTVYAILTRMEARGDVAKIGTEWGLAEWYPGMRKDRPAKTESSPKESRSAGDVDLDADGNETTEEQPSSH